jgi:Subtilase family/Domain of unknown function (DUF4214)
MLRKWLTGFKRQPHVSNRGHRWRKRRLLVLEPLEDRNLLATALGATSPEQFTMALYTHLLQRQPAFSEVQSWALTIDDGSNPAQIARSFIDGDEYRADLIRRAYQQYLHRNPEPGAVSTWLQAMGDGLSYQSFVVDVVSSQEYLRDHGGPGAGWLTALYEDLLGRSPDAPGLAAWMRALAQGVAPSTVAQAFVISPENLGIYVKADYQTLLGRAPDPTGFADWVGAMEGGLSFEQVVVMFADSPEFIGKQLAVSPPSFVSGTPGSTATAVTLVTPTFSSISTPTIALNFTPSGYSGTVFVDVDLQNTGVFAGPGDLGQTVATITPQDNQVTLNPLSNGTFDVRVRVDAPNGQTVASNTVQLTVDTNDGFIGSNDLLELYNKYTADLSRTGALPADFFQREGEDFDPQHRVDVNVHATLPQGLSGLNADLINLGMAVQNVDAAQQMVIGYLPITMISQLTTLPNFASVTPIYAPRLSLGSAESQGDAVILGPPFRAQQGANGTGVTVGVLSDSANQYQGGLSESESTGNLIASHVKILKDGPAGSTDEGRAMMEIVADVAPGSNQYFYSGAYSPQDMANGILRLASAGATVISDDLGYADEPMFNDGIISQAVEKVVQKGVFYASAAGNSGPVGYMTNWSSAQGTVGGVTGTFLDIGGGNVLQTFTLPPGETIEPDVQWDDAFLEGGSPLPNYQVKTEIDVYITSPDGSQVYATLNTNTLNTGEALQFDPSQAITNTGSTPERFAMAFQLKQGPAPTMLRWVNFADYFGGNFNILGGAGPTVFGHPVAAGAAAVAAVPWFNPRTTENYSALGGEIPILFDSNGNRLATPDVRTEPGVAGPDGVDTSFFGSPAVPQDPDRTDTHPRFYGTSAATPHVAAAAALYQDKYPGLTPAQILQELESNTLATNGGGDTPSGGHGTIQMIPIHAFTGPGGPTGNAPWGQTSNTAANLGVLTGTEAFTGLAIKNQPDGLPGNQWVEWTAGQSGIFSAQLLYMIAGGGDLNFRLFTLDPSTNLVQLAGATALGVTSQNLSASVTAGETLLLWIYGYDQAQGNFSLNVTLG